MKDETAMVSRGLLRKSIALIFVLSVAILTACAPTRGMISTSAGYEATFKAAAQAVVAAGFSIRSSDITTGVISAERTVRQARQDRQFQFNVLVRRTQTGAQVEAVVAPPHGSVSGTGLYFDTFVRALQKQLPGVQVLSRT